MIVVAGCFRRETRWIERRPGLCVVRTRMGEASAVEEDALVDPALAAPHEVEELEVGPAREG